MERIRIKDKRKSRHAQQPNALNGKVIKAFCSLIKRGLPVDSACDIVGITTPSFWQWVRRGEEYINGGEQPKHFKIYGRFVVAYRKALAKYKLRLVDRLNDEGNSGWVRQLAILERRDRTHFSKFEPKTGDEEQFDPDERFL